MAELDLSLHSLNNSSSKQKYSFPKSSRFADQSKKMLCDSYYEIPTTTTKRATSLGYGVKTMGLPNKTHIPAVGAYELGTEFNPEKNKGKGFSFGEGRQDMELGGPLKDVKLLKYIPGPGNYEAKDARNYRATSLRSRLPDTSQKHLIKVPGPGAYTHESFANDLYYITSKHRNHTNLKISQVSRLDPIKSIRASVGPADYKVGQDFSKIGRYNLSNHENSKSGIFGRSARQGIVEKGMELVPGPGQYKSNFSSFGAI